jgi:hypothetical protein
MKNAASLRAFTRSTTEFYFTTDTQQFPNPLYYSRDMYVAYRCSHSHDPKHGDDGYDAHIAAINAQFDLDSVNAKVLIDWTTSVTTGDFI